MDKLSITANLMVATSLTSGGSKVVLVVHQGATIDIQSYLSYLIYLI